MFFNLQDTILLISGAGLLILHLLVVDKGRIMTNLLAVYASFLVTAFLFPRLPWVGSFLSKLPYSQFGLPAVFLLLAVVIHLLLRHTNVQWFSQGVAPTQWQTSLLYRFVIVGFVVSASVWLLPASIKAGFGPLMNTLFGNTIILIVWAALPIFFAFLYRFKTRDGWIED